jgi:transposase InsO family protein
MSAKYACMAEHAPRYPVRLMARVLGVSASGYYAAQQRPPSARAQRDADLTTHIAVLHHVSRGTYGAPRVQQALQQAGEPVSRKRVARLMQAAALRGTTPRRWRASSPSDPTAPTPNVLARAFAPSAALNTAWAADITYLPYAGGTAYLAVVLDVASRRVIGWALEPHLLTTLPAAALETALATRRRRGPTLHHSDRGTQYVSAAYRTRLETAGLTPSLSATGNCYDNAVVESFFNTLKRECPVTACASVRALRAAIGDYIDGWYNPHRLHSSLGYQSPVQYERQLRTSARAA